MSIPILYGGTQYVALGPFVDETDGYTPETGLTIANTDIQLLKYDGTGAFVAATNGATHIGNGVYVWDVSTLDSDHYGPMAVSINVAGARPVRHDFLVLPTNTFGSLINNGSYLPVDIGGVTTIGGVVPANVTQINNDGQAAANLALAATSMNQGIVDSGATTTSLPISSLLGTMTDLDQLKGRVLIFLPSTLTAGLAYETTEITGSTAAHPPTLTVTALSTAPQNGDTFIIV